MIAMRDIVREQINLWARRVFSRAHVPFTYGNVSSKDGADLYSYGLRIAEVMQPEPQVTEKAQGTSLTLKPVAWVRTGWGTRTTTKHCRLAGLALADAGFFVVRSDTIPQSRKELRALVQEEKRKSMKPPAAHEVLRYHGRLG